MRCCICNADPAARSIFQLLQQLLAEKTVVQTRFFTALVALDFGPFSNRKSTFLAARLGGVLQEVLAEKSCRNSALFSPDISFRAELAVASAKGATRRRRRRGARLQLENPIRNF
jgi:hypothetical protein